MAVRKPEKGEIWKIYCNTCNTETNHELRDKSVCQIVTDYDPDTNYRSPLGWEDYEYRFWVCRGCDSAVMQELYIPVHTEEYAESEFYPIRKTVSRQVKHYWKLDRKLSVIYKEVVHSYNNQLTTLCAMGLRALLEGVCVNLGVTDEIARGPEEKIGVLEENKLIPVHLLDSLLSFKFIGDQAAHKLHPGDLQEMNVAIEIMEDILNYIYEFEYKITMRGRLITRKRAQEIANAKARIAKKRQKSKFTEYRK